MLKIFSLSHYLQQFLFFVSIFLEGFFCENLMNEDFLPNLKIFSFQIYVVLLQFQLFDKHAFFEFFGETSNEFYYYIMYVQLMYGS